MSILYTLFFGLLCLSDGTLFNISVIFLCQNFSQIYKLTCILIIIITWKFRASYEPIKSLPLHLHCMPTGQPCIWLIVMSLEYMYPWGIDFVLIIIWLWVQLMIYTTVIFENSLKIAWAFKWVQFERIFKYCKRCKSLIARVFRYDYSFIIWLKKL